MSFTIGKNYSGAEINNEFGGGTQAGIRKAKGSDNIVLIAKHINPLYQDGWQGNLFHYTGSGTKGDQDINKWPNSDILNSSEKGYHLHLFECYIDKEFIYLGEFILDS